ncbi:hypothetical protein FHR97_001757 [Halomonas stenophila]|uniref:TIR domain-containing protein n=1 Tax=Halomonas stenophila TaxID=795312 RepID=A0A7W5HJI6_9GAMM|nr:hypothetical protein [Halomonas stenophila]
MAGALEADGWSVWRAPRLRTGEHVDAAIERELGEAQCVIVLWSSRFIASQDVKDEATYGLTLNKRVLMAIDDVTPSFRPQGRHTHYLRDGASRPSILKK